MLFSCLVLAQFITLSSAVWNMPTYIKFSIDKYTNNTCSSLLNNNETNFLIYCPNPTMMNGTPSCCYDQLNKLSPIEHTKFNTCYNTTTSNGTSYYNYECKQEKIQDVTVLQVFGVIGALTLCGFFLVLLYSLFRIGTRKGYNKV
jgi:hypothetical protein